MNVGQAAHLSGQMSGQAAQMNQVPGSGVGVGVGVGGADGLPQHQAMQEMAALSGTDQQFVMLRHTMREKIFECIGRKQSSAEWRRRLPELAKRLEEILYRKFPNKNDYYNMMKGPVEPQLQFAIKTLSAQNPQNQQNSQMSRQIASSSGYGTMIPTPGMTQGTSASSRIPYATDNNTLSSSGAGMVPQNTNMGTSLQGSMSNGYQHLNNSIPQNSATNNIQSTMGSAGVQRQLPHMIPTPGFSNQQNVPANPDYSNGTGYFNGESGVAPHMQHQKQFPSNQNSNQIQHIGGLSNSGIHSSMLDNSSGYGLSDGHMNGGIGVHGSNMQLTNRTTASEAYMNISPYGNSPKPIQQQFNQHPQQRIPTSVDMAGSDSFYPTGSTPVTTANSQSMNVANLQSRSRVNQMLVSNQLNIQSIPQQPQIKNEVLDQTEKVTTGGANGQPRLQPEPVDETAGLTAPATDQQFVMLRTAMREKIFEYIGRRPSSAEWRRRLPELAKRLEDILYTKFPNRNDYYNMTKGPVEPQLQCAIRTLAAQNQQNQRNPQVERQTPPSSSSNLDMNHDVSSEQFASLQADMQNNNADEHSRTE